MYIKSEIAMKSVRPSAPRSGGTGAVCSVCLEPIKKHKCVHYGAITCYSCRAFFRRTCIEKRAEEAGLAPKGPPKYECKTGGRCGVVGSDRRKCRVCRFKRCLHVGMKPDQVLSQEEKEVRFKRFFKRRHEDDDEPAANHADKADLVSTGQSQPIVDNVDDNMLKDPEPMILKTFSSEEIDQILSYIEQDNADVKKSKTESQWKPSDEDPQIAIDTSIVKTENLPAVKQEPVEKEDAFQHILEDLQTCEKFKQLPWEKPTKKDYPWPFTPGSCNKEKTAPWSNDYSTTPNYFQPSFDDTGFNFSAHNYKIFAKASMMASIKHPDPCQLSKQSQRKDNFASKMHFQWLIKLVLAQYEGYLGMTPQFRSLHRADQVTLQARNSKLFLMYVLGRFFSSNTVQEQTKWIYGEDSTNPPISSSFVSFQSFANIFSSDHQQAAVGKLLDMSYDLKLTCPIPTNSKNLVALFLSFQMADTSDFVDPGTIQAISNHISTHLHLYHYPTLARDIQSSLMSILSVMSTTFDAYISCDLYQSNISKQEIPMPFTMEERMYLKRQLARYQDALKSVPCGESVCREFLMFTYGAPPSPSFTADANKVFMERAKRVLQLHQEFQSLPTQDQAYMWHANGSKAAMMYMLALEACQTGSQQLEMAFSELDITEFHANFTNSKQFQSQLRALSISDMMPSAPEHTINFYKETAQKLSKLSKCSPNIQPLMMMICIFSGTNLHKMDEVRNKYLLMLERETSGLATDSKQDLMGGVSIEEVRSGLGDVDKLSHMMRSLTLDYWPPETNAKSHEFCTDGQY